MQAKNTTSMFSLILQRYSKLVAFGTLGMPGHPHPRWNYQLVEYSCLFAGKKSIHTLGFSEDIAKICKLLILGSLGMPGYTHPK